MSDLVVLRGNGNRGKSTTIGILYETMKRKFNILIDRKIHDSHDFYAVFDMHSIRIGITSYGDTRSILDCRINHFISKNCEIIVCACRSEGRTLEYIENIEHSKIAFIEKSTSINDNDHAMLNNMDANILLEKIELLIQTLRRI